ncbi:sodium-dependent phosphate transport protein 2B-like isoform X2 [Gigantopelta aegis]|uniref:sodium-dependent phosphate transport protein 2B-like isoform X2 n=1 Tax=Gigantopelta aegis TaxID=1735272 RepID=UPI001B88A548|nr:sodium-dependent phosphate transport protein 2B-like isoform X2 [Gigantopelta aegis]
MAHARDDKRKLQRGEDAPPSYTDVGNGTVNTAFESGNEDTEKDVGNGTTNTAFESGNEDTGKQHTVTIESNGTVGATKKEEIEDPWKASALEVEEVEWSDLSGREKCQRVLKYVVGLVLILLFLYMFICSLDFLSTAFKLLGGKQAGRVFQQNEILHNPVAGLMIGILVTVLVQSSSTSTSLIISMVGGGLLDIKSAIPMVMGANIGTSVTNTIVALGQIVNKGDFRRAFAGATVHDMFNWLSVLVLLPLEVVSGYLFHLSSVIVDSMHLQQNKGAKKELLKVITKPFTELIVQIDKSLITDIAKGTQLHETGSMMKTCCDKVTPVKCCSKKLGSAAKSWYSGGNYTKVQKAEFCFNELPSCVKKPTCMSEFWESSSSPRGAFEQFICTSEAASESCCRHTRDAYSMLREERNFTSAEKADVCSTWDKCQYNASNCMTTAWNYTTMGVNDTRLKEEFSCATWISHESQCMKPCTYAFKGMVGKLNDEAIGAILLVISLVILCICLISIVKLLNKLLRGQIATIIKKFINADFPGYLSWMTGYLAIVIGAGLTILVQSSSIFTSSLTPLVGIGVIEIERMYPLTLGANIGTTTTGILAAMAQPADTIANSLQVAFCHLFFNISGILLFYPLPFLRLPIRIAKFLGNETAKYRWFAIMYLLLVFFVLPAAVFGLSVAGLKVLAGVLIPIGVVAAVIIVIKVLQSKKPSVLPRKLRDWKFLPKFMRSLEPLDRVIQKLLCGCCSRFKPPRTELATEKDNLPKYDENTTL